MMKRNRILAVFLGLMLAAASNVWAVTFTGVMSAIPAGAIPANTPADPIPGITTASNSWTSRGVRLDWTIDDTTNPGLWTYHYTLSPGLSVNKGVKYFDLEVEGTEAGDFLPEDIANVTTIAKGAPGANGTVLTPVTLDGVRSLTDQNSGNPTALAPHPFHGIRWLLPPSPVNDPTNYPATFFDVTFTTVRGPMWGDFFVFGDQTNNVPNTFATAFNNQIDNLTRLTDPPANNLTGTPPLAGWVLVPGPDSTTPAVKSTTPLDGTNGVLLGTGYTAVFSKAMDPATITTATCSLSEGNGAVAGSINYDPATRSAVFTPATPLARNTVYTMNISGASDKAAAPVNASTASFTTVIADGALVNNVATIGDALRALRITVNLVTPDANDLNHLDVAPLINTNQPQPDGTINIADALAILKKVVNLINF